MTGIERIAAERKRQIEEEGFTAEYDERFTDNELVLAALCYALPKYDRKIAVVQDFAVSTRPLFYTLWPFRISLWKPTPDNRIRELEKAGALIAAEIDRLQRLEEKNEVSVC
jgi:hypothetical protein